MAKDGDKWRRVVASPQPIEILEARVIEGLLQRGVRDDLTLDFPESLTTFFNILPSFDLRIERFIGGGLNSIGNDANTDESKYTL